MTRSRFSAINESPIIAFAMDSAEEMLIAQNCLAALNFRPFDADDECPPAAVANYMHTDLAAFLDRQAA